MKTHARSRSGPVPHTLALPSHFCRKASVGESCGWSQEYAKIVCCIMDIPVYNNLVESLHVLFTLYSEFKNNQHFQQQAEV